MLNQVQHDSSLLGKHFFLTQRIRSLRLSKGTCLQKNAGISTTLSDRVGGTRVYLANGAAPICHPELDSGSVDAESECFTDPESSSG